jgi:APA family basic amino acid/polyamine antiporter
MTASAPASAPAPARELGVLDAAFVVTGSIIGAGIFLVSGVVAEHVQSPAGFLGVWLVGGLLALAGALTNGELGSLFPRGGGEYVYLREAYGPAFGFLSGWASFWIGFPGSIATLAAGFGLAVVELTGIAGSATASVLAIASVVGLTIVNALGLRPAKWTQNILSSVKLVALVGLLAAAAFAGRGERVHFTPFFASGERAESLAIALVPVLFAYTGWNAATYVAGEMRDARRNLARALVLGTGVSITLYLAINAAYVSAFTITELRGIGNPAQASVQRLLGPGSAAILTALVAVSILSSLQATILTGPRIYQAMAEDALFPQAFARLHRRTRVPVVAMVFQGLIACALLLSGTFERLLAFTTFAIVLFSTLAGAAAIVLRIRRPEQPRAFRVPGYPFTPLAFVAANLWVLVSVVATGAREALVGLAIVALGVPAYLWFRRRERLRAQVGKSSTGSATWLT